MKKDRKISIFEIVWYSITGAVALWGLTYIVLGLVHAFYPSTISNNPLNEANEEMITNFGLGFLYWGLIIMAIGVVSACVALCICAKTTDREAEKANRRAARLAAANEASKPEVVDAEVAPAAEESK
mgnify:CR=1 FL=1